MALLYKKILTPEHLKETHRTRPDYVQWEAGIEDDNDDLRLRIKADSSDWERVFQYHLIDRGVISNRDDITIKLKVGVILPEPKQPRDPMSYMVSDGDFAHGFQIMDPNHDYAKTGPYQAVEGEAFEVLGNPKLLTNHNVVTTSRRNPDVFEITLKPHDRWGTVYCAIDDGHKIVAQYSRSLRLSKGLYLETYRYKASEVYTVNYIDVEVYLDSDKPLTRKN